MPIYQYRCTNCGEDLEIFQRMTEAALDECPSCSGELRKVFAPVGIVFKGSGFYATDSKKSSSAASVPPAGTSKDTAPTAPASDAGTSSPPPAAPASEAASAAKD